MADTLRQQKKRQMDVAISFSPERRSFVQSFQEFFPYYKTKEKLPRGMYVGQLEIMQDGRWYRICQSHEPNKSGQNYGIEPGYQHYWAGPEFTAINSASNKQIRSFETGDVYLTVYGMDVAYDANAFQDGYMRVTGGDTALGYQMLIKSNDEATPNTADSTKWDTRFHFYTPLPFGVDTSESTDVTGLHFQGNKFGCQKVTIDAQSVGGTDRYDYPRLYNGHSLVRVPYKHYYWAVVGGPGVGIAQTDIDNTRVDDIELTPYQTGTSNPGGDAGKLVVRNSDDERNYCRVDVRSEVDFSADAYVPIWIHPK